MRDLGRAHVEAFLEMMSAERGAAQNTLLSYERDLDDLHGFLSGKSVRLTEAASADLTAYLKAHQADYRTKETRTVDLMLLSPTVLAQGIIIPPDKIQASTGSTR